MKNATIQQHPYSVIVTDFDPVNVLESPSQTEAKKFQFNFGEGSDYPTREEATRAAEWFVKTVAPIL